MEDLKNKEKTSLEH